MQNYDFQVLNFNKIPLLLKTRKMPISRPFRLALVVTSSPLINGIIVDSELKVDTEKFAEHQF